MRPILLFNYPSVTLGLPSPETVSSFIHLYTKRSARRFLVFLFGGVFLRLQTYYLTQHPITAHALKRLINNLGRHRQCPALARYAMIINVLEASCAA